MPGFIRITVTELRERAERELAAEKAARTWMAAKEALFETGVPSAPICGFRESLDGSKDFLTEFTFLPSGGARETYASGTRIEYAGRNASSLAPPTRAELKAGDYKVFFPDGGVLCRSESREAYMSASGAIRHACVSAVKGRPTTRFGASNRLFQNAQPPKPASPVYAHDSLENNERTEKFLSIVSAAKEAALEAVRNRPAPRQI